VRSVSTFRRYAGLGGAALGVVAAGAAAGVFAERKVVARRRAAAIVPFGSLRGVAQTVTADDGVELYVEVDEPERQPRRGGSRVRPTLVFVHGYALNLDAWHFQRAALRGGHRLVLYDQRSHGRSGRSDRENATIDQLGLDLAAVLEQVVGDGPVVLVGHSMGGMAVMALASQRPALFGDRVVGAALIASSAGSLNAETLGLPGLPGRVLHRLTPAIVATLARAPRLVESGRRAGSDIGFVLTRRLAFGGPVPQEYVDFTDEMLAATPFEVVAEFFPGFDVHDRRETLAALAQCATTVVCGSEDAITPIEHSRAIADLVPTAEFLELGGAGHMVLLERHDEVTAAIAALVERVEARR
jgi:pimeloyl-ACP methyl ester carboxylesterase